LVLDVYDYHAVCFENCKGYNQASQVYVAEMHITQPVPTANITAFSQYGHFIEEFQFTSATPDATHLDRSLIETDGLIKVGARVTTTPTITGSPSGSTNEPFILMIDVHYQLVPTTGTNPVADTGVTSSNYFVFRTTTGAGNRISNIKISNGVMV